MVAFNDLNEEDTWAKPTRIRMIWSNTLLAQRWALTMGRNKDEKRLRRRVVCVDVVVALFDSLVNETPELLKQRILGSIFSYKLEGRDAVWKSLLSTETSNMWNVLFWEFFKPETAHGMYARLECIFCMPVYLGKTASVREVYVTLAHGNMCDRFYLGSLAASHMVNDVIENIFLYLLPYILILLSNIL